MKRVELTCRRVRDQGTTIDCCTSCALAACLEALHPEDEELSPLFHYHLSRPGRAGHGGMTDLAALHGAHRYGLSSSRLHPRAQAPEPVTPAAVAERPSDDAVEDGRTRRLQGRRPHERRWRRMRRSDAEREWKAALDRGHPIFVGILLDPSYEALSNGGDTWRPRKPSGRLAGHAVAVLGYDDAAGHFIVQDSRGAGFGREGRWFLSYDSVRSNSIQDSYEILPGWPGPRTTSQENET